MFDIDPLYYVIRLDQPVGWVPPNDFEQWIYQLPHTGTVYNIKKKIVWGKILKAYLNNPSWEWIKEFEATEDSRAAWKLLVKNAIEENQLTSGYCLQWDFLPQSKRQEDIL